MVTFTRRAFELLAGERFTHLVHVERAGFFSGLLPEIHADAGEIHRAASNTILGSTPETVKSTPVTSGFFTHARKSFTNLLFSGVFKDMK